MKLNKKRIRKCIRDTESWLESVKHKEGYEVNSGMSIVDCEKRNLEIYKRMLGHQTTQDLQRVDNFYHELYMAI